MCIFGVSFRGKKNLGHAQIGLLQGFDSKFSDEHPHPFHMRSPPHFVQNIIRFKIRLTLPSPQASFFLAAKVFRVTWSMRKCEAVSRPFASDTSPKRADQEGLGKRRTRTRQRLTGDKHKHSGTEGIERRDAQFQQLAITEALPGQGGPMSLVKRLVSSVFINASRRSRKLNENSLSLSEYQRENTLWLYGR